jgi:hypothetical protein
MSSNDQPSLSPAPRSFKLKNKSFIRPPLITVTVGKKSKAESFSIHKDAITEKSDFVKNGLSGRWTNSDTNSITLDHLDPIYFALYLETVYTNEIKLEKNLIVTEANMTLATLASVYVIAEEMLDSSTKNTILRVTRNFLSSAKLTSTMVYIPPPLVIKIIYNGTSSISDPARRLLVTTWRARACPKTMTHMGPLVPHEFLVEFSHDMLAWGKASEDAIRDFE